MTDVLTNPAAATAGEAHDHGPAARAARRKEILNWIAVHSLGIAAALFFVLPFVFVFLTSVMSDQQTLTSDLWPKVWDWDNYTTVWRTPGFAGIPRSR
jgi:multiple sugar transport system permease protein